MRSVAAVLLALPLVAAACSAPAAGTPVGSGDDPPPPPVTPAPGGATRAPTPDPVPGDTPAPSDPLLADDLAEYAVREGFDWRFAMADPQLVALMTDRWGFAVTNPPSTPTFIVSTDGTIRALEFGRLRNAEELVAELAAG